MTFYSDVLTRADLDRIAADLGLVLYNAAPDFHGARRRRIEFTLRPAPNCPDSRRAARLDPYSDMGKGWRRIWAVSWSGHFDFMASVYERDPAAEFKSAIAGWKSREEFYADAPATGDLNVGSMVEPLRARDASVAAMLSGQADRRERVSA